MGHSISAIITKAPVQEAVASSYDLPVFVESGFAIIALFELHTDFWSKKLKLENRSLSKIILDDTVTHFFAKELGLSTFAVISANYFGGVGEQYATLYRNDELVLEGTINEALKALGVQVLKGKDAFDSIGLSKYRDFSILFKKYWPTS